MSDAASTQLDAGAAAFAGLKQLAPRLAGRTVAIPICGSNESMDTLRRVFSGEL